MNRLETVAPDLVEQLRAADEADRRRATAAAVELAVERSGVNQITILEAAKAVRPEIDQTATAELRAAAQARDEAYLKLHERLPRIQEPNRTRRPIFKRSTRRERPQRWSLRSTAIL